MLSKTVWLGFVIIAAAQFEVQAATPKSDWVKQCLGPLGLFNALLNVEQMDAQKLAQASDAKELEQLGAELERLLSAKNQKKLVHAIIRIQTEANETKLPDEAQSRTGAKTVGELLDQLEIAHATCPVFRKKPNTPFPIKDANGKPLLSKEQIFQFCDAMDTVGPILKTDGLKERAAELARSLKAQSKSCAKAIQLQLRDSKEKTEALSGLNRLEEFALGVEVQIESAWKELLQSEEDRDSAEPASLQQDVK